MQSYGEHSAWAIPKFDYYAQPKRSHDTPKSRDTRHRNPDFGYCRTNLTVIILHSIPRAMRYVAAHAPMPHQDMAPLPMIIYIKQ